jgi:hypothetical protein
MTEILPLVIRFALSLETRDVAERGFAPNGMAFHRWIPNGRDDRIQLATGHADSTLHVWFKRWGWVERREGRLPTVHYQINREELTEDVIGLQGRLSSGPLLGEFRTVTWGPAELKSVKEGATGAEPYLALGRRVIDMIVPPLQRLLRTVQIDYGQYWLRDLEDWDSRSGSLGNYCRMFQMQWSLDDGEHWQDFAPDENVTRLSGSYAGLAPYRTHLSRDDWYSLPAAAQSFPASSVALELIGRAREMEEFRRDLRLAIVETATAAEVAVDEFLSGAPESGAYIRTVIPEFRNLSAQAQFSFIAAAVATVSPEVLLTAAPAWRFRHKVVHEGWLPVVEDRLRVEQAISGLQQATAAVLGRSYRRVSAFNWGAVASPESWEADTEPNSTDSQ